MNLVFHLSRDYLTQPTVEQYIELAHAFGVQRLALVCTDGNAKSKSTEIRNIRKRDIAFELFDSISSALTFTGGTPLLLSKGATLGIESYQWTGDETIVVGDDRVGFAEPDLPGVKIETPGPFMWSQQAAAIGLWEASRRL